MNELKSQNSMPDPKPLLCDVWNREQDKTLTGTVTLRVFKNDYCLQIVADVTVYVEEAKLKLKFREALRHYAEDGNDIWEQNPDTSEVQGYTFVPTIEQMCFLEDAAVTLRRAKLMCV